MPRKKTRSLRCPICRTLVTSASEDFPFCSDRCRTIDLGKWASGKYVISTAINDPEELENIAEEQSRRRPSPDGHSSEEQ
ncbi:MAG TPA: DNA gyrase inhibitor YacG [Candidatus Angelobacter sp.]|nr:DNA gyrase inhibitor YacG [Candidatus Angelobacter sp.]